MFDITGQDISLLSDEDLRELIGRLCEADLRQNDLSPLNATWGGDQDAPDGGIDVRIAATAEIPPASAIACANVGYQVKAEKMSRSKILSEMRPEGSLRASILELVNLSGAYIIISSKDSVTDTSLRERKEAMKEAVADVANASELHLDFYDRNRIATWVRDHPRIVAWVRKRIGRPLSGWCPYGDWAGSREGIQGVYLVDDALRIQGPSLRGRSVSAVEGINLLRDVLSSEQGIVRLIGLSGTGKTRLAQALFDERVGENSLPPELAVYANLSVDLEPQPVAVATDLLAQGHRQVLVIDNCPPDLHSRLTEICRTSGSRVSLFTIEYDVREDQPEGTDVFELQPSSDDLIEKLLLRRVHGLSDVNARSIAMFASGNARVALALANTVESGESVASLRSSELFERLFRQRHESSSSLPSSAQACSLPYSFQGEDSSNGSESELSRLAAVVGKDIQALHADIAELKRRDLIQQRGVWRAVLPHAIANRLAATALENIIPEGLEVLFATAPPRLLKSISRRLGYLHTSDVAQKIVRKWLSDEGRLGRIEELDETRKTMLTNVAPVAPTAVLDAIERAIQRLCNKGKQLQGEEFRTLLLSLAFERDLFDRSVALILDLIESEEPNQYANHVRSSFPSLFHLYLSGTHATVEQRIRVIDTLLSSNSQTRRELGFASLDAMLQSSYFTSSHRFDFGGRPRDYGYFPKTQEDVLKWFRAVLELCATHDARDAATSSRIRTVLAHNLHGLWSYIKNFDEIDAICRQFHQRRFWPEGWIAIRSIRCVRQEVLAEAEDTRLAVLEKEIAPESIVEQVHALVLRNLHAAYEDIDLTDHEAQIARRQRELTELGKILAIDPGTLAELIPDLVACNNRITLEPFAKGLVDASVDRRVIWDQFIDSFIAADPTTRSPELLACYLCNLQSVAPGLVEMLLQEASQHPCLSEWFPILQTRVVISKEGILRLKKALADGVARAERFLGLAYSGTDDLDDGALCELIPMILSLDGGFQTAAEIVWMRLPHGREKDQSLSPELLIAGRFVADAFDFNRRMHRDNYRLGQIFELCLSSAEGVPVVERMLERLKGKNAGFGIGLLSEEDMLGALAAAQPVVVLNALLGPEPSNGRIVRGLAGHHDHLESPFNRIPPTVLFSWCDEDPTIRYPLVASMIKAFDSGRNSNEQRWKDIALALLQRAPDRIEVLKRYINQFCPIIWSKSPAIAWAANAQLLDTFENHPDVNLAEFARSERQRLRAMLDEVRREELESERRENERFE